MQKKMAVPLLLRGKVVHADGSARDRYIMIRDGRIESVSRKRPPCANDAIYVKTDANDWIFPGLLDLHTHSAYNILPIWDSTVAPFKNRHIWRRNPGYRNDIRHTYMDIFTPENRKTLAVFAELQAVAGGTTVLQESKDLDREFSPAASLVLCRDTANASDLEYDKHHKIYSVIDFFKPGRDGTPVPQKSIDRYVEYRKRGKLLATLAHLAEGRSGFGSNRGADRYSRLEFEAFMRHPAFKDAAAVRETPLSLIHCSGIDTANSRHLDFLLERNISVIWSPVSNLLLYGDTLDVEPLIEAGINVALGSDWSPSGSKHVWDEAKFARFYFNTTGSMISDTQIFQMVTTHAAKCLSMPDTGSIAPGSLADFFILRSPLETDNALEVFFATEDKHVRATIIGGCPVYGEKDFLKKFKVTLQNLPKAEGAAVKNKTVHLDESIKININRDVAKIEKNLKSLEVPVKRSNLLASSDKPYQRRIQDLCSHTVRFGWSVRQWRRKGPAVNPGVCPVAPDSVRVWRGFQVSSLSRQNFKKELGSAFIPTAVQTQVPLGMTAYLPTVLPDNKPEDMPDEIALVFYESQEVYKETFDTPVGRAYGLLHRAVFSKKSKSGFPKILKNELLCDQPYFLFSNHADWHNGETRVLCACRSKTQSVKSYLDSVYKWLRSIQKKTPAGLDAAIVCVGENSLIYWEHWHSDMAATGSRIPEITDSVDSIVNKSATPLQVPADWHCSYQGPAIKGGDSFNLQFLRRMLIPR
ncbi:amidohydrolase family protein [Lentisphaerota bacterium ZTH]|nr:amidohydrolase family protein [Lentisphaerota bacterium]WET05251.1 amidohydrolase family protein [Lentisphaerota bacterium ZTH]